MGNQVHGDSSYPGERRVRVHRGVAQGRNSEKGKRNRIEKKTKRQAAGQEGSIVIEELPECLGDDLERQSLPHAQGDYTTLHLQNHIRERAVTISPFSTFIRRRAGLPDLLMVISGSHRF